jgi:ribosomal protein S18 acetylase RimI-like enzyme
MGCGGIGVAMGAWGVRAYQPGDEAALVALWNTALPRDPLDADTFAARVLADANFLSSGLVVAAGAEGPLGFALALSRRVPLAPGEGLEPETGWITAFGVHPAARRRGVGTALLEAACAELQRRGCRRVEISPYAPGYFWPGVDTAAYAEALGWLQRRGFRSLGEAVAMERSLSGYLPPPEAQAACTALEADGVALGPLGPEAVVPLIAWAGRTFHPDWGRAVREAVARGVPWRRTLLARDAGGAILGFAQYGAYDRSLDRFGPFGVDPAARRRGIGRALLHLTLQAMQREGCRCAWFLWTGEHSPAGALYRGAGFRVSRRFALLRRDLAAAPPAGVAPPRG